MALPPEAAEALDDETAPERLAEIAERFPALRSIIAMNPACPEGLREAILAEGPAGAPAQSAPVQSDATADAGSVEPTTADRSSEADGPHDVEATVAIPRIGDQPAETGTGSIAPHDDAPRTDTPRTGEAATAAIGDDEPAPAAIGDDEPAPGPGEVSPAAAEPPSPSSSSGADDADATGALGRRGRHADDDPGLTELLFYPEAERQARATKSGDPDRTPAQGMPPVSAPAPQPQIPRVTGYLDAVSPPPPGPGAAPQGPGGMQQPTGPYGSPNPHAAGPYGSPNPAAFAQGSPNQPYFQQGSPNAQPYPQQGSPNQPYFQQGSPDQSYVAQGAPYAQAYAQQGSPNPMQPQQPAPVPMGSVALGPERSDGDGEERRGKGCIVALLVLAVLVAVGIAVGAIMLGSRDDSSTAGPSASATAESSTSASATPTEKDSTTPSATPTPTLASPAPTDAVHASSIHAPSGNITCELTGDGVGCSVGQRSFEGADDCTADQVFSITAGGDGAGLACGQAFGDPGAAPTGTDLAYGTTAANGSVACRSEKTGMTCWNQVSGHGFTVSRSSYTTF